MMSAAMIPLRDSAAFCQFDDKVFQSFLGILAGAAFTAIIQSSSASVGIPSGFGCKRINRTGQRCLCPVRPEYRHLHHGSPGLYRGKPRRETDHPDSPDIQCHWHNRVYPDLPGVPFTQWMASFTPDNPAAQIANVHTLFNIITTLLLLPFGTQLARISEKLLPDKPQKTTDEERWFEDLLASEHVLGVSVIVREAAE